ncbi:MAG: ABC transporter permease [Candidatus Omnitrophica bacterium]|nr:ABC transporter permease [Candidatus Omnitrophota bacterium]MBU4477914.1 ABC transporter permease [Candidatus Omnitrophota bacterium]MCG2703858.1 ABC transporter permease [Candidatus Omnitrophota bacterium]
MLTYFLRRLFMLIPLLIGISLISFLVIHLAPGKPTDVQLQLNQKVSLQVRERLEKLYGLDEPLPVQYAKWLSRLVRLDFGNSFIDNRPVMTMISERIPVTLTINLFSLLLILLIAVPIGVFSAVHEDTFFDRAMTVFVFIGFAMPTFWLALLLMKFFGVTLHCLPVSGIRSISFEYYSGWEKFIDYLRHLLLPVIISAFTGLAGLSRYMRTSMINVLHQDYIRTAKAKGLPQRRIYFRHAMSNALLPVITLLGLSVPGLIGGSVIAESIFAIPGMGKLFYDAVMSRDYPVIMGVLVIGTLLTLVGNLAADLAYSFADPRIRTGEQSG